MASTLVLDNIYSGTGGCAYSRECGCGNRRRQTLALNHSQFLSPNSLSNLKKQSLLSLNRMQQQQQQQHLRLNKRSSHPIPFVFAAQSDLLRVLQTVWKVGKDGIEAGTSLVPDTVPRPIARISVTGVALTLALFVLKSFLSTAFFVLATMGLVYFVFIALNKDEGPRGGGGGEGTTSTTSTEDSLEEARRIMEKYK